MGDMEDMGDMQCQGEFHIRWHNGMLQTCRGIARVAGTTKAVLAQGLATVQPCNRKNLRAMT